jgi:hypothetical protein
LCWSLICRPRINDCRVGEAPASPPSNRIYT